MKKVCFVISGSGYSGAEVVLNRYLENNILIDKYFIIIFKNNEVENKLIELYGREKVFSLNLHYNKNLFKFLIPIYINKVKKGLRRTILKINPELIYVNNTFEGILSSKYIKSSEFKSILHIHDMRQCYTHPYNNYVIGKYFKYYTKILTVSESTRESWKPLNMEVIYNGLSPEYFRNKNFKSSINNIGFVGSLNKRKGADIFINSLNYILEKTNLEIFIAFKDYEKNIKNMLYEYKSNSRVHIMENINEMEIMDLYNKIDLLIVPSRLDPLPTVIMEAQARGVLVLGNNSSGIPEMIPIDELVININSKTELCDKINNIINLDRCIYKQYSKTVFDYTIRNFKSEYKQKKINMIINKL